MKPIKSALACLTVTGLLLSQPAAAAALRSGSSSHDSERLADGGLPSAAIPALIGILAVAIVAVVASSNDNEHHPASP